MNNRKTLALYLIRWGVWTSRFQKYMCTRSWLFPLARHSCRPSKHGNLPRIHGKYLGEVVLGWRVQYKQQSTASTVVSLGRRVENVDGKKEETRNKKFPLISTTNAILVCVAEVWAGVMKLKKYGNRILEVQHRGCLAPNERCLALHSPLVSFDMLAVDRETIFEGAGAKGRAVVVAVAREETLRPWQRRWFECSLPRGVDFGLSVSYGPQVLQKIFTGLGSSDRLPRCVYCPKGLIFTTPSSYAAASVKKDEHFSLLMEFSSLTP